MYVFETKEDYDDARKLFMDREGIVPDEFNWTLIFEKESEWCEGKPLKFISLDCTTAKGNWKQGAKIYLEKDLAYNSKDPQTGLKCFSDDAARTKEQQILNTAVQNELEFYKGLNE